MDNPMLDLWYQYHEPFIDEYTLSDIVLGFSELVLTESRDTVISLEDHAFSLHPLLLEEVEEVLDSFQDLLYHVAALQSNQGFLIDPEPSCQSVFRRAENFRAIELAWDTFSRRIFLAHHWFRLHCFSLPEFSEEGSTWREVQRLQIQRDISKSRVTMGGSNTLTDCLGVSSHRHASPVMDCLAAKAPELELGLAPKRQSSFLSPSASSLNSPNQRTQGLDALCLDFDPSNTECYVDSPFVNTNSLQLSLLMFEASDQLAVMETLDEIELDMYGCLAEERVAKPGTGTYQSIGNLVSDNRAVCSAETTPGLSSFERSASVSPTSPLLEPRLSPETLSSFDFAMSDISVFRPSPPIYSPTCALLDNKLPLTNVLCNQSTSIIALIRDQRTKGGDDDGVAQLDVNEAGRSVSIESPPSNPSSETLSPQRTSSQNSPRVIARGSNVLMDSLGAPSCRRAPLAMDSLAGRAPAFELNLLSPLLFKSTSPFPAAPSPDDIERDFARLLVGTMDIGKGQPSSRLADTIILSPSIARSGQTLDLDPATIESYLNAPLTITNELPLSFSMIHTSGQFDRSESSSEIQIDTGDWSCKEPELGNEEKSVSDRQPVSSADTSSELLSFPVLDNVPLDPPTNVLRSIKQVGIQHLRINLGAPSCGFAVPETDEPIRYSAEILAEQRRAFKEDTPMTTPQLGYPSIIELGALRNKDYPPSHALEGPRFSDTSPRDSSSSLCSVRLEGQYLLWNLEHSELNRLDLARIDKGHGVSDTARTYLRANTPYSVSSSPLLDHGPPPSSYLSPTVSASLIFLQPRASPGHSRTADVTDPISTPSTSDSRALAAQETLLSETPEPETSSVSPALSTISPSHCCSNRSEQRDLTSITECGHLDGLGLAGIQDNGDGNQVSNACLHGRLLDVEDALEPTKFKTPRSIFLQPPLFELAPSVPIKFDSSRLVLQAARPPVLGSGPSLSSLTSVEVATQLERCYQVVRPAGVDNQCMPVSADDQARRDPPLILVSSQRAGQHSRINLLAPARGRAVLDTDKPVWYGTEIVDDRNRIVETSQVSSLSATLDTEVLNSSHFTTSLNSTSLDTRVMRLQKFESPHFSLLPPPFLDPGPSLSSPSLGVLLRQRTSECDVPRVSLRGLNVFTDCRITSSRGHAQAAKDCLAGKAPELEVTDKSSPLSLSFQDSRILPATLYLPSESLCLSKSPHFASLVNGGYFTCSQGPSLFAILLLPLFDPGPNQCISRPSPSHWGLTRTLQSTFVRFHLSSLTTSPPLLLDLIPGELQTTRRGSFKQVGIQYLRIDLSAPSHSFAMPDINQPIRYSIEFSTNEQSVPPVLVGSFTPTSPFSHSSDRLPRLIDDSGRSQPDESRSAGKYGDKVEGNLVSNAVQTSFIAKSGSALPYFPSSSSLSQDLGLSSNASSMESLLRERALLSQSIGASRPPLLDPGPSRQILPSLTLVYITAQASFDEECSQMSRSTGVHDYWKHRFRFCSLGSAQRAVQLSRSNLSAAARGHAVPDTDQPVWDSAKASNASLLFSWCLLAQPRNSISFTARRSSNLPPRPKLSRPVAQESSLPTCVVDARTRLASVQSVRPSVWQGETIVRSIQIQPLTLPLGFPTSLTKGSTFSTSPPSSQLQESESDFTSPWSRSLKIYSNIDKRVVNETDIYVFTNDRLASVFERAAPFTKRPAVATSITNGLGFQVYELTSCRQLLLDLGPHPPNLSSKTLVSQQVSRLDSHDSSRVIARGINVPMDCLGASSCRDAEPATDCLAGEALGIGVDPLPPSPCDSLLFLNTSSSFQTTSSQLFPLTSSLTFQLSPYRVTLAQSAVSSFTSITSSYSFGVHVIYESPRTWTPLTRSESMDWTDIPQWRSSLAELDGTGDVFVYMGYWFYTATLSPAENQTPQSRIRQLLVWWGARDTRIEIKPQRVNSVILRRFQTLSSTISRDFTWIVKLILGSTRYCDRNRSLVYDHAQLGVLRFSSTRTRSLLFLYPLSFVRAAKSTGDVKINVGTEIELAEPASGVEGKSLSETTTCLFDNINTRTARSTVFVLSTVPDPATPIPFDASRVFALSSASLIDLESERIGVKRSDGLLRPILVSTSINSHQLDGSDLYQTSSESEAVDTQLGHHSRSLHSRLGLSMHAVRQTRLAVHTETMKPPPVRAISISRGLQLDSALSHFNGLRPRASYPLFLPFSTRSPVRNPDVMSSTPILYLSSNHLSHRLPCSSIVICQLVKASTVTMAFHAQSTNGKFIDISSSKPGTSYPFSTLPSSTTSFGNPLPSYLKGNMVGYSWDTPDNPLLDVSSGVGGATTHSTFPLLLRGSGISETFLLGGYPGIGTTATQRKSRTLWRLQ